MTINDDVSTRGERTRQAILDAAESLFLARGYNGTTMRQIAHDAGDIAVGGIYNHFANKEDIFRALLEARSPYDEILDILVSLEADDGPRMLAEAFIRLQDVIHANLPFFGLVLIDVQEFDARTVRQLIGAMIPPLMSFGAGLEAAGHIADRVEFLVMMRVFASMLIGYTITTLIATSNKGELLLPEAAQLSDEYWEEQAIDVLLYGIMSR